MATHASRNTTTGLMFEDTISMAREGINLTKHNLLHIGWREGA